MTLPTMKPGDRVRITVEGEVKGTDRSRIFVLLDSSTSGMLVRFDGPELTAPTARVEVLLPSIEVGDVVNIPRRGFTPFVVLAAHNGSVWLECEEEGLSFLTTLSDLTLVSKASKAGGRS